MPYAILCRSVGRWPMSGRSPSRTAHSRGLRVAPAPCPCSESQIGPGRPVAPRSGRRTGPVRSPLPSPTRCAPHASVPCSLRSFTYSALPFAIRPQGGLGATVQNTSSVTVRPRQRQKEMSHESHTAEIHTFGVAGDLREHCSWIPRRLARGSQCPSGHVGSTATPSKPSIRQPPRAVADDLSSGTPTRTSGSSGNSRPPWSQRQSLSLLQSRLRSDFFGPVSFG